LQFYYPDFFEVSTDCKFNGCTHTHEPGCEVKRLVDVGKVPQFRYDNYVSIYQELAHQKPKYRRDEK